MSQPATLPTLDFETRIRRSQGRTGRTHSANVKLTRNELSELEAVAKLNQKALGEWAREALLREARRSPHDPVFTEIVATRILLNLVLKHVVCGETISEETYTEVLARVRTTKHKQALELMRQYAATDPKES